MVTVERAIAQGEPVDEVLAPSALRALIDAQVGIDCDPIAAPVPAPMTCYRGLTSLTAGFGTDDPFAVTAGPHRIEGYLVLVHGRWIDPAYDPAPIEAAIECAVPAGIRALWLAGPGDPCSLEGGDIILLDRPLLEVTGARREATGIEVVEARVVPG